MSFTRRNLLKMGAALAAVPLVGDFQTALPGTKMFTTGSIELDHSTGGGFRLGSVVAVVGPRGSGKTAFLLRLAKANGVGDSYLMNTGTTDMLSM